ncbi:Paraquat-inducible protein A [Pedobacter steynii]|uniref:Paraquat-inducible protein A n=1 Tax=Pedobacter steynii TaxID=430522 RepID=A0A1H0KL53_9SPHI|nr:paraquat-inducible protein A [Pedobacter steynii]NQX43319.1 paraquat-inducible protein A [Pedobacter steynii]SDO56625.1 Paraquat-inducible protein A [Pedobacter steynii]
MKATKKTVLPNILLLVGLSLLLCGEAWFGYRVSTLSSRQEEIKSDYSVANNITFGILSVDQWREKMAAVVEGKVNEFNMTTLQKKELQKKVEQQLNSLLGKAVNEFNKPQKSIGGKLKKLAFNAMVDQEEIQAEVPAFAATIVARINKPASKKRLKNIISSKVDQLEKETFDNTEPASVTVNRHIYKKYGVSTSHAFDKTVNTQLAIIQKLTRNYTYAMIGCVLLALCLWFFLRKHVRLHTTLYILSLLFAFVLLFVGVTATIIEVDARIQSLNFTLLSEKLAFTNQVLFFQSKSISGVVKSLVEQPKPDAVLVGILILLFVIVLPVLRMIGKGILIWGRDKYAENKLIRFLALDLGKWDMADVMVVGIAMTYIGLNGILQSQLSGLNIQEELLSTVTQNNTSLQPGYYIFVAYVVYATILSMILKRINPLEKPVNVPAAS